MRAERPLGEMIRAQKETVGLANGGDAMKARFQVGNEVPPTIADAGIDKKHSSRAQKQSASNGGWGLATDDANSTAGGWRITIA